MLSNKSDKSSESDELNELSSSEFELEDGLSLSGSVDELENGSNGSEGTAVGMFGLLGCSLVSWSGGGLCGISTPMLFRILRTWSVGCFVKKLMNIRPACC